MQVSSTARRYGRALARVAIQHRREKTVGEELQGVWTWLRDTPLARLTLESPATNVERKKSIVASVAKAASLSDYTANFLRLLVEGGRFALFRETLEAYRQEVDRYHGRLEVQVVAAQPLDDTQRETLRGTLARTVGAGKDIILDMKVDPSLVAGAVVRVGSVVYDGSLNSQLNQLKATLISE